MTFLIKKGKPIEAICKSCGSLIGYYQNEIITKPDKIYSYSVMNKWIICPECGEWIYLGNYAKYSDDQGNWKEKIKEIRKGN